MRENWRELNLTAVTEQQQQLNSPRIHSFNDKPESKSQVQAQSQIEKGKRNLDSGLSLKSHGPPPPHP